MNPKTPKTTKTTDVQPLASTTLTEAAPAPGRPPPEVNAPATPSWWKATKRTRKGPKGLRPKKVEVDNTATAAAELQKSTTYVEDFGSKAPDATTVAATLLTASQWRESWAAAAKWLAYCSEQRQAWEQQALTQTEALKPAFDYATSRDASIAKKYPSTKQLLGARSEIGKRGGATRKKKKEAAAQPTKPNPPKTG